MHWFPKRDNLCGNQWKSVFNGMAIVSMVIISVMFVYGLVRVACLTALFGTPHPHPHPAVKYHADTVGNPPSVWMSDMCLNIRRHFTFRLLISVSDPDPVTSSAAPWDSHTVFGLCQLLHPSPPFTAHLSTLTHISTTIHKVLYVVCVLVPLWVFKYTCLSWYPPGVCVKTV